MAGVYKRPASSQHTQSTLPSVHLDLHNVPNLVSRKPVMVRMRESERT